jgi:hypothetical protein
MNVVFLSPHFPPNFQNFCAGLRAAGAKVLGVADAPWDALRPELKRALAEYYRVGDLHSYDELVRAMGWFIHRHGRIDRIDSLNEYWLETEARLRDDFNVPGLRSHDMGRVKRKSEMKEVFLEAGLDVPRGWVCPDAASTHDFAAEVGYPFVAKPDVGVGAAQTFKIRNDQELEAYLLAKPSAPYILEEYVQGDMVTYDGLVDREGQVAFDASLQYARGIMEVVNEGSDVWYWAVRDIPEDLAEAGRAIVEAFELRERFFHFEFFRRDGRLVALEVNMRPPGGLTVDMWNYQNDVDMYRAWADLVVTGRPPPAPERPYAVAWIGRKDRFRYALSEGDVLARFGHLVVHQERVQDVFAAAIGNYGFILRSPELDELRAAERAIHAKA